MTAITIYKGDANWFRNLPQNVWSVSDLVWSPEAARYEFTGFLGALCAAARAAGIKHTVSVAAIADMQEGMVYTARHIAGHGRDAVDTRMFITPGAYALICACAAEDAADFLPPEIAVFQLLNCGAVSFIPAEVIETLSEKLA